jgi:hypothetical protein
MRCSALLEADHCPNTVRGQIFAARDTERDQALTCKYARWLWFEVVELRGIEPLTLRLPERSAISENP